MKDGTITDNIVKQIGTIKNVVCLKRIIDIATRSIEIVSTDGIGWFVGQEVKMADRFSERKLFDIKGIVLKVNTKNLKVDFGNGRVYNCPKTMMVMVTV